MTHTPPSRTVWCAVSGFLGLTLLVAAFGKAWTFPRFVAVVTHVVPGGANDGRAWAWGAAITVVAWEAILAACFLSIRPSLVAIWALLITLSAFSAVLVLLWADPAAPPCGCFGLLPLITRTQNESASGLVRNAALLWLAGWMLCRRRAIVPIDQRISPVRDSDSHASAVSGDATSARRAFTIIEMLIAISVVAILLALVLPGLFRTRQNTEIVRSLGAQRQILSALDLYSAENLGFFPYLMTPGDPAGPKLVHGFDLPVDYFKAGMIFWPNRVYPDFLSSDRELHIGDPESAVERNFADGYPPQTIRCRYNMTATAFAHPDYWRTDEPPTDLALLRGTQPGLVRFASSKGLTIDISLGVFADRDRDGNVDVDAQHIAVVGFADGSARTVPWPSGEPDWSRVVERPFGAVPWPVFSTRNGLAGIDF